MGGAVLSHLDAADVSDYLGCYIFKLVANVNIGGD